MNGTLWDSTERIAESWQEVFNEYDCADKRLTVDDVKSCMGLPMDDFFRRLFPDIPLKTLKKIQAECEHHENKYLSVNAGKLYHKVT